MKKNIIIVFLLLLFLVSCFVFYVSLGFYNRAAVYEKDGRKGEHTTVVPTFSDEYLKDKIELFNDRNVQNNFLLTIMEGDFYEDDYYEEDYEEQDYDENSLEYIIRNRKVEFGTESFWSNVYDAYFSCFRYDDETPPSYKYRPLPIFSLYGDLSKLDSLDVDYVSEDFEVGVDKMFYLNYMYTYLLEIDRSSEGLKTLWSENNQYFYSIVSNSLYEETCAPLINELINNHDTIFAADHFYEYLEDYNHETDYWDFPSWEFVRDNSFDAWSFTFWYRRILEDNSETVYDILVEIKNHYKDEE